MKKLKTLFIRGSFLNQYEGQNYELLQDAFDMTAVASLRPIGAIGLRTEKFLALRDISSNRIFRGIVTRIVGDDQYLLGLEHYVKNNGPFDIAHGAETYFGYTDQLVRLKKKGYVKKIISTCWEIIPHNNESIAARKRIKQRVIPHIDAYICPSKLAKKALEEEGVDQRKIHVIRVGISGHLFDKGPKVLMPSKVPTILFVGRLVPEKGILDFLEMIRGLDIPFTSRIVGTGPLTSLAPEAEVVSYAQMPEVYSSADVIVIPSRRTATVQEQYCMVAVESLSAGLPIIYYDSGALREVIGPAGIRVEEGNIDEMRRQLLRVLTDKKVYRELSLSAQSRFRKYFDSDIVSRQLDRLYHTVSSE